METRSQTKAQIGQKPIQRRVELAQAELVPFRAGRLRWQVRRSASSEELGKLLRNPDAVLGSGAALLANSELITMARIGPLEAGGSELVLRRLNYGRWRHRLRDVFRQTRVERAFWHGLGLERAGVRTALVVAVGVERFGRWPRRGYLLTEWVTGAVSLKEWLERDKWLPRAQVYQLAELLAGLHNAGFSHRDLKSSNVLFGERFQPYLIDLDGVRSYGELSERRAVADLARFAWEFARYPELMKGNGRRFLRRYCRMRGIEDAVEKLEAEILKPTRRRLAAGITKWK